MVVFESARLGLDDAMFANVHVALIGGDMGEYAVLLSKLATNKHVDIVTSWVSLNHIIFGIKGTGDFINGELLPFQDKRIARNIHPSHPIHFRDANLQDRIWVRNGRKIQYFMLKDVGHAIEKQGTSCPLEYMIMTNLAEPGIIHDLAMYLTWPRPTPAEVNQALKFPAHYEIFDDVRDPSDVHWTTVDPYHHKVHPTIDPQYIDVFWYEDSPYKMHEPHEPIKARPQPPDKVGGEQDYDKMLKANDQFRQHGSKVKRDSEGSGPDNLLQEEHLYDIYEKVVEQAEPDQILRTPMELKGPDGVTHGFLRDKESNSEETKHKEGELSDPQDLQDNEPEPGDQDDEKGEGTDVQAPDDVEFKPKGQEFIAGELTNSKAPHDSDFKPKVAKGRLTASQDPHSNSSEPKGLEFITGKLTDTPALPYGERPLFLNEPFEPKTSMAHESKIHSNADRPGFTHDACPPTVYKLNFTQLGEVPGDENGDGDYDEADDKMRKHREKYDRQRARKIKQAVGRELRKAHKKKGAAGKRRMEVWKKKGRYLEEGVHGEKKVKEARKGLMKAIERAKKKNEAAKGPVNSALNEVDKAVKAQDRAEEAIKTAQEQGGLAGPRADRAKKVIKEAKKASDRAEKAVKAASGGSVHKANDALYDLEDALHRYEDAKQKARTHAKKIAEVEHEDVEMFERYWEQHQLVRKWKSYKDAVKAGAGDPEAVFQGVKDMEVWKAEERKRVDNIEQGLRDRRKKLMGKWHDDQRETEEALKEPAWDIEDPTTFL